jgi:hypothetical protein
MQQADNTAPRRFYGRPADQSFEAFKDFVRAFTLALNPEAKDEPTEEQWRQAWKAFWGTASGPAEPNQQ